ncbi:MAG: proline iminopeptidase, partial [Micromonosporaceae bacterium]|nr:proline iminopeptidase [Micromonosporaceae bacterium]
AHNWCFQHNWSRYDVKPGLPSLRFPTLVTVGRRDWVTPVSSSETIASLIPNAKLVIFEKSGHSPQIEEFELFQQVMREFLDEAVPAVSSPR